MSSVNFPIVGGRVVRGTVLDACGVPAWGDKTMIVSEGVVSVAVKANYDDGTEKTVTNFAGKKCVYVPANGELTNLEIDVVFCDVDPDFYTLATGMPKVIHPGSGDTIGFRLNRGVRPGDVSWALETWTDAQGSQGCGDGNAVPYGYFAWPYLSGGKPGDYTIEDNAVTFSVTGIQSKDGSQWGRGPYLVAEDDADAADLLQEAIDLQDHQITFRTTIAPPVPTGGLIPLDDPDSSDATGATAGIPGAFTPAGGVRPANLAGMTAITATPGTAWTTGQFVYVGDGSKAHWSGTAWAAGAAS